MLLTETYPSEEYRKIKYLDLLVLRFLDACYLFLLKHSFSWPSHRLPLIAAISSKVCIKQTQTSTAGIEFQQTQIYSHVTSTHGPALQPGTHTNFKAVKITQEGPWIESNRMNRQMYESNWIVFDLQMNRMNRIAWWIDFSKRWIESNRIENKLHESTNELMFDQMNRDESQTIGSWIATNLQELLQTNANGRWSAAVLPCLRKYAWSPCANGIQPHSSQNIPRETHVRLCLQHFANGPICNKWSLPAHGNTMKQTRQFPPKRSAHQPLHISSSPAASVAGLFTQLAWSSGRTHIRSLAINRPKMFTEYTNES